MSTDKPKEKGIFSSIFIGYAIILMHVLLVLIIGVAVVFFRGVTEYMLWILLGGLAIILASGYYFYRRIKQGAIDIKEVLNNPAFRDRGVEVKLLGGVASLRVGQPVDSINAVPLMAGPSVQQLESPESLRMRELEKLVHMRESNLVSQAEFEQLKRDILKTDEVTINPRKNSWE